MTNKVAENLVEILLVEDKPSDTELTPDREKTMEKVVALLLKNGSDTTIKTSDGLSVLLLALRSRDPVPTTRILLKCGLWKHVNSPGNQYRDDTYVYSPTQYVRRLNPKNKYKDELVQLLLNNRATDAYYAHNGGPQPPDAMGLPPELAPENAQSLGLRLVDMLTHQLRGKLELDRNEGTAFRLTFAPPEHESSGEVESS